MSVAQPIYQVRFSGSAGWLGYNFGWSGSSTTNWPNYVSAISVKPGITKAIGSFEINIPETGSNGEALKTIQTFDDVWIWLGYNQPSVNPLLRGKIDTIKTSYDYQKGWIRTFSGRDYGETLFRTLERRSFTGSMSGSIVLMCIDSGLSTDYQYIEGEPTSSTIVLSNDNCFTGIEQLSEFSSRDFYVDTNKKLHWFTRQSTTHANPVFTAGTNILNYNVFNDIADCKNQIYVFGMRDPSNLTGSDWPVNHNGWTEADTAGWTGWIKSGSGPPEGASITIISDATYVQSGSTSIFFVIPGNTGVASDTGEFYLHKVITGSDYLRLNDGDFLHLYGRMRYALAGVSVVNPTIRLETDANNYFKCKLDGEHSNVAANGYFIEKTISVGPTSEGISSTGSLDTYTGSYKWSRIGNPDWYKINAFSLYAYGYWEGGGHVLSYYIDGLYFGAKFQYQSGSTGSQTRYGLRELVIQDSTYNSNEYCKNVAITKLAELSGSILQVELLATGSPELQVGDLYHLSIPSDGITTTPWFELIDLEHRYIDNKGFTSKCILSDRKQIRVPVPIINYPVQQATEKKRVWAYIPFHGS